MLLRYYVFELALYEQRVQFLITNVLANNKMDARSLILCSITNMQSKWLIAVLFGVVLLWRHDAEAVWVAMGSVLNSALSVTLKRILNQERPTANLRSDPGMPSSHAQSIFFAVVFVILSGKSL